MTKQKFYKDEKYIYLLMAYNLAKANKGYIKIGNDNGYIDGWHYERIFKIEKYNGKIILIEKKSSKSCADFSRFFEIIEGKRPTICDYMNEDNENCGQCWTH